MPKFTFTFHVDWDNDDPEADVEDAVLLEHEPARYLESPREFEERLEKANALAWDCLGKFLQDDCCMRVEFDTTAGTARVLERTQ